MPSITAVSWVLTNDDALVVCPPICDSEWRVRLAARTIVGKLLLGPGGRSQLSAGAGTETSNVVVGCEKGLLDWHVPGQPDGGVNQLLQPEYPKAVEPGKVAIRGHQPFATVECGSRQMAASCSFSPYRARYSPSLGSRPAWHPGGRARVAWPMPSQGG